jgi:hypothetical protein
MAKLSRCEQSPVPALRFQDGHIPSVKVMIPRLQSREQVAEDPVLLRPWEAMETQ